MNDLSMPVMPYYCTDVIRQCIKKGLTENPQKFGVQAVARGIDIPVSQLSMQFADMARCVLPGVRNVFFAHWLTGSTRAFRVCTVVHIFFGFSLLFFAAAPLIPLLVRPEDLPVVEAGFRRQPQSSRALVGT